MVSAVLVLMGQLVGSLDSKPSAALKYSTSAPSAFKDADMLKFVIGTIFVSSQPWKYTVKGVTFE